MGGTPKRIAIYGGAFDPFHKGHLATIVRLLESGRVDSVIVVPCSDRPDKSGTLGAEHRLAMARLGVDSRFAGDNRVEVSDAQVARRAGFATIDLLSYFKKELPTADLFVVIGEELVRDLPSWKDPERLKQEAHFLVLRRPGSEAVCSGAGWQLTQLTAPYPGEVEISSTELRELLRSGSAGQDFLPRAVRDYIIANGLYR